ncbi:MAG TPA: hypothetical protein VGM44_21750, partial [Polyangiaceae bacterium]
MVYLSLVELLPPILRGPLFVALFFWFCTALGYRVLRWLRVPLAASNANPLERGVICFGVGAGVLQYLPLALGFAHHLSPSWLRTACALLALALLPDAVHVARGAFRAARAIEFRPSREVLIWLVVTAALLGVVLLRATVVADMGDDDGYHLTAAKRWLASGTVGYLPTFTNTNAAMGFEMLYSIALAVCDPVGAKLVHYGAGLLLLLTIALSARRLSNVWAGLLAISLLLITNPLNSLPFLLASAYVDFGAALMATLGVLVWLLWRDRQDTRLLACLALCVGFAGSFKITALTVAIIWSPLVISELYARGTKRSRALLQGAFFFAIACAPVAPWLVRNWLETGNPIYPLASSIFPTRDWTPEHGAVFSRYMHYYSWAVASGAELSLGARRMIVLLAELSLLAGTLVALRFLRERRARALLICGAVFIGISIASTGVYARYWLPALIWWTLVLVTLLAQRWPERRVLVSMAIGASALALGLHLRRQLRGDPKLLSLAGNWRIASGQSTFAREYPEAYVYTLSEYINAHTPPNARVLMVSFYSTFGASSFGGFWVDRPCYATDTHLESAIRFGDFQSFKQSLQRLGVTHIVISDQLFTAGRVGFDFAAGKNE